MVAAGWEKLNDELIVSDSKKGDPLENVQFVRPEPEPRPIAGNEKQKRCGCTGPRGRRVLAVVGTWIAVYSVGAAMEYFPRNWEAITKHTNIPIIGNQAFEWYYTLTYCGLIGGSLFPIFLMNLIGRKSCILLGTTACTIGFLLVVADGIIPFVPFFMNFGRLFTAFHCGLTLAVCQVYITEVVYVKRRGLWLAYSAIAFYLGKTLVILLAELEVNFKVAALICALPSFISFIILLFVFDSPNWLLRKSRSESKNAHMSFYGKEPPPVPTDEKIGYFQAHYNIRAFLIPFIIICTVMTISHVVTLQVGYLYALKIITTTFDNTPALKYTSFALTPVHYIGKFIAWFTIYMLVQRVQRRRLLIITIIGSALVCYLSAFYFSIYGFAHNFTYVPIPFTLITNCFLPFYAGWQVLPWLLIGEFFPYRVRPAGVAFCTLFDLICPGIISQMCLVCLIDTHTVPFFYGFGTIVLIIGIPLYKFMPSTKDKTIAELDKMPSKPTAEPVIVFTVEPPTAPRP